MDAAKAAILKCVGRDYQVQFAYMWIYVMYQMYSLHCSLHFNFSRTYNLERLCHSAAQYHKKIEFCSQVWYDTTLTKADKPSICTAFMATLAPTDGPTSGRKLTGASIILPTTVLGGCKAKLPVLCM